MRIRVASDRPDSARKTWPIWTSSTSLTTCTRASARSRPARVPQGANLDRHPDDRGRLRRPGQRGVEVVGLDEVEPAQVLLRLDERPVRRQHLTTGYPHDSGGVRLGQAGAEYQDICCRHLGFEGVDL